MNAAVVLAAAVEPFSPDVHFDLAVIGLHVLSFAVMGGGFFCGWFAAASTPLWKPKWLPTPAAVVVALAAGALVFAAGVVVAQFTDAHSKAAEAERAAAWAADTYGVDLDTSAAQALVNDGEARATRYGKRLVVRLLADHTGRFRLYTGATEVGAAE